MVRLKVNVGVLEWAAGDEVTVERTALVDGLIRGQKVTVLEENVADFPADDITVEFPDTLPAPIPGPATAAAARAELSATVTVVPPRTGKGATVPVWREFLAKQGIHAPADANKATLIGLWDSRLATDEYQE